MECLIIHLECLPTILKRLPTTMLKAIVTVTPIVEAANIDQYPFKTGK
mgnify:CR=1 FL=1